jgi:hypothetical protein
MATARVIPPGVASNPSQTITIDGTLVPSPQGCIVSAPVGQQIAVTFNNTSGSPISITFTPQGVFADIPSFTGTQTRYAQGGTNTTVNYVINGVIAEPYAIQIGSGPMVITLSQTNTGTTQYSPNPVAVPLGDATQSGTVKIVSAAPGGAGYNLTWKNNNDPFLPPINSSDATPHPVAPGALAASYDYSAGMTSPQGKNVRTLGGGGGGTVKIRPS